MTNSFKEKLLKIVFIYKLYLNLVKEITGFDLEFFTIACILSALVSLIII